MAVKLTYVLGGLVTLVMYVLGVIWLASDPDSHLIPTPGMAVVGGVLAMFAALGVFIIGFLHAATAAQD